MSQESGFLFLPDCEISFWPRHQTSSQFYDSWVPITVPSSHPRKLEGTKVFSSTNDVDTCPHCCLAITCQDDSGSFSLVEPSPRFDGMMDHVKPSPELCKCQERLRQRTDGALMLGLVLTCQEMGHVQILSIEVMLKHQPTSALESSEETSPSVSMGRDNLSRSRQNSRAALAVTIRIPEVQSSWSRETSQVRSLKRRFISNSPKPLPPATQLLLSILRTDWSYLENIRRYPYTINQSPPEKVRQESLSLFPSAISLDEVYKRIGGAADSLLGYYGTTEDSVALARTDTMTCYNLPNDVWQFNIAVFLRAKSLDALRCSSKRFHRILQDVVPGLNLRLYAHQVKSLSWMRQREARCITENDMASLPIGNVELDMHSAATGGATVLLRSRDGSSIVRISQYTGEEEYVRMDHPLPRNVARGGLLCDDPGLGKTITVLSLVLQTFGLSTERMNKDKAERTKQEEAQSYDERIFHEYWRENSIPTFRSQALNKLLSTFIRENYLDTLPFVYPVDPERDGVPNYFEVIAEPICLQLIRKQIGRHHYDPEFASFERDVLLCFR